MEKYGTARRVTNDNIIRYMHFACWITNAKHTQNIVIFRLFGSKNVYVIAPELPVVRTLPLLFSAAFKVAF